MVDLGSLVPGCLPIFDGKLFDNWRVKMLILVKTYGNGEKNKKVKLQTLRRQYELHKMEDSESIANYFDRI
ncbi:hypothetical protein CR513_51854, partial [Mucuna pruriens]